jgi:heme a synthase
VRLTGSGLSIPDWPMINGSLLPPTSNEDWQAVHAKYENEFYQVSDLTLPAEMPMSRFKTMFAIEYIHRSLVAIIGLLFLVVVIKSLRHKEIWRQTRGLLITAAVLLLGQAILGGVVVKQELRAELVAIHLGIAFLFLSLLLWMALGLSRPEENVMNSNSKFSSLAWLAVIALWIQIVIGGLTAGTKAGLIFNSFPKMGDYLIPPLNILASSAYGGFLANLAQNQILIQFIHRWWAFVALIFIIALVVKGMNARLSPRGRIALRLVGTITVFQILWGILNLLLKVPVWVSLVHLGTALLIFALLILITHEARYEYVAAAA